jgi:hypothetical protein
MDPFFSSDGQWVGFVSGNKLNKISVEGGAVVPLWDGANVVGASWGEDGAIVVGNFGNGLLRIPSAGGPPETIAALANGELGLFLPQILPGAEAVLFTAFTAPDVDKMTIEVLTLADRHRKILARGGGLARYLPHIYAGALAISPDGTRVAAARIDPANSDIWLTELSHASDTRFTFDPARELFPVWSPDGSRIAFSSERAGAFDLYQHASNGSGQDELLFKSDH